MIKYRICLMRVQNDSSICINDMKILYQAKPKSKTNKASYARSQICCSFFLRLLLILGFLLSVVKWLLDASASFKNKNENWINKNRSKNTRITIGQSEWEKESKKIAMQIFRLFSIGLLCACVCVSLDV